MDKYNVRVTLGLVLVLGGCAHQQTVESPSPKVGDRCVTSLALMRLKSAKINQTVTATLQACARSLNLQGLDPLGREVIRLEINDKEYQWENTMDKTREKGVVTSDFLAKKFGLPVPLELFMLSLRQEVYGPKKGCASWVYERSHNDITKMTLSTCQGDQIVLENTQFQEVDDVRLPMSQTFQGKVRGQDVELALRYKNVSLR